MEYVDLVAKIVAAEQSAQSIAREVREKQEHLDAEVQRDVDSLREDCMKRARHRVALVEETERTAAQEAMAAWDRKLSAAMTRVEEEYAGKKDAWADAIFHQVIGQ